jgi:hypothetical protein
MIAKRLKEILVDVPDDTEIFIRNSVNPCGNIDGLQQIQKSSYSFFGTTIPCIILNTSSSKELEVDEKDYEVIDLIVE